MGDKPDYRDFIVDHPACRASVQLEHMDGTPYEDFEKLRRSLRPGSIARVYRPYLLGGGKGQTRTQRKLWVERADAIKSRGNKLVSFHPPLSGHALAMRAFEEIGNVARGKAGTSKQGRPVEYDFTPEQWEVIGGIWTSRGYKNDKQRLSAIKKRFGKTPGRSTLRNKFGSPHKAGETS